MKWNSPPPYQRCNPFGMTAFYQPTLCYEAAKPTQLLHKGWGTHAMVRDRKKGGRVGYLHQAIGVAECPPFANSTERMEHPAISRSWPRSSAKAISIRYEPSCRFRSAGAAYSDDHRTFGRSCGRDAAPGDEHERCCGPSNQRISPGCGQRVYRLLPETIDR